MDFFLEILFFLLHSGCGLQPPDALAMDFLVDSLVRCCGFSGRCVVGWSFLWSWILPWIFPWIFRSAIRVEFAEGFVKDFP